MENLNKENFWNDLYAKNPLAVKEFCDWVDKYKQENNWDQLFNAGYEYESRRILDDVILGKTAKTQAPKFHDLPIAMQTGIWLQFIQERGGCHYEIEVYSFDLEEEIVGFIRMMEEALEEN